MKSREVQGQLWPEMLQDSLREFAGLRGIVVQRGNHQVGYLEPYVGFIFEPPERIEHRLQMSQRDFPVEALGEGFEVHVCGVDVIVDVMKRLARDVAIRTITVLSPYFFAARQISMTYSPQMVGSL